MLLRLESAAMTAAPPRALCLAGPTASGKTAVAMAFAAQHARVQPVEIVSVDSALVYRGMDIGTAKPSAEERAAVPHHLIDLIDPAETYSAARFVADANRAIGEIHGRGHLPLLVGGTMLYFKALREGIDTLPAADTALRTAIDQRAAEQGWPAVHAELARVDPATAARLAPGDSQRIQRALEVFQLSGRPLSSWHGQRGAVDATRLPLISLEPVSRGWLHGRIQGRLRAMFDAGFTAEVQRLRDQPGLQPALPSMRSVGYRQLWQALDEGPRETAAARAFEPALAATRQLAKRQLTWLRSMPDRQVVRCDAADALAQAIAALLLAAGAGHDAAR